MLAKTAGVKHLVVLINKMDDPTVNWDEERYIARSHFGYAD
jgi:peptide chain release factor subunit 3